jgi:hypothetical protein
LIVALSAIVNAFEVKTDLQLELKSRRISKGKVSNPDPVGLFDLKLSYKGLYGGVFGINDLTEYNKEKDIGRYEFERYEYRVGYADEIEDIVKYDVGYLHTDYVDDMDKPGDPRHELYLKLTAKTFLSPGVKFNYDTQHEYFYVNPFVKHDVKFSERLKLKNELNLYWYNRKQMKYEWKIDRGAFTCLYFKTYLQHKYNDYVSFGPLMEVSYALDRSVREAWRESSKNNAMNFLFGVKLDIKF